MVTTLSDRHSEICSTVGWWDWIERAALDSLILGSWQMHYPLRRQRQMCIRDREKDLADTIERSLDAIGPVMCNVIVDPDQNFVPKLSSKVLPDGRIISPSMDDMFPFLPREEYESNRYSGD